VQPIHTVAISNTGRTNLQTKQLTVECAAHQQPANITNWWHGKIRSAQVYC